MVSRLASVGFAAGTLWLAGCRGLTGEAADVASAAWSCPSAQIKLLTVTKQVRDPPPPEVIADSERMAVWQGHEDPDARGFVFTGCGETGIVTCGWVSFGPQQTIQCKPPRTYYGINWGRNDSGPFGMGLNDTMIASIRPTGPADTGGLAYGDVILQVDHQPVGEGPDGMNRIVSLLRAGPASSHVIDVRRGTSTISLTMPSPAPPANSTP
jgi:hypothetical protein